MNFFDKWFFPIMYTLIIFMMVIGMTISIKQASAHHEVCESYGTTYYPRAHACLTTYGALIVPKEFR
jgi:hypothetical protein